MKLKPIPAHMQNVAPQHQGLLRLTTIIKKTRTKMAFTLAILCLALAAYHREAPLPLEVPSVPVEVGLFFIVIGMGFRIVALGTIHKNDYVNRIGVYSLCRHPLYFGTLLIGLGLCLIASDLTTFLIVTAYFLVYYSVTIAWEERLLRFRFGDDHADYCRTTPLLLFYGRYVHGPFDGRRALKQGAAGLVIVVILVLVVMEVMARNFQ